MILLQGWLGYTLRDPELGGCIVILGSCAVNLCWCISEGNGKEETGNKLFMWPHDN